MSLERGRRQENLRTMNSIDRSGHGFELPRNAMNIQLPETDSNRTRSVAHYPPHTNFEALEFELSYRHE
jgi:hypothetical protein